MYCKSCGTVLEEGYMVCPECGTRTGEGSGYCPSCGKQVIAGSGFCANCGASFADNGPVQKPVQTAAAPKAKVVSNFNLGDYFKEFVDNFTGVFKDPGFPDVIFEYGTCFTSVLVLLLSFLPCYFYIGITGFHTLSVYQHTWLAGLLLILAVIFSVRQFLPHVFKFVNSDPMTKMIASFFVPALHLLSLVVIFVQSISDLIRLQIFVFPFVFGAMIILITLAEIGITIFNAFIRKK